MMRKILFGLVLIMGIIPFTILWVVMNVRLYSHSSGVYTHERFESEVLPQLRFIRSALGQNRDVEMQSYFPEGYFFTNVLYGMSWVNVGLQDDLLRDQALTEAEFAYARVDSARGRSAFSSFLTPPYGVFYEGWRLWLLGGILSLQADAERDPARVNVYQEDVAALVSAFEANTTPFLTAYPGRSWPVDSTVAVASIQLHDTLFAPQYADFIQTWLDEAFALADPQTGLLPHEVRASDGVAIDDVRSTSQSLIIRFLYEIDPPRAEAQYQEFRRVFFDRPLGVPAIREYVHGVDGGWGDVDSGPLILGISASSSAVSIGTAQVLGDDALATTLLNTAEAVGLPLQLGDQTVYAFGILPVGDAFLAWARTSIPWAQAPTPASYEPVINASWRLPIHVITLVPIGILWIAWFWTWRKTKR